MDIRDIKYFHAIAEEGTITNAAKRLHMAQPPLSRQLKQLENSLGVQLFERSARKMRLTEAGQLFLKRTAQILLLVDNTVNEMSDLNSGLSGTLILGTITTSGAALLPSWIRTFHDQFPNITFQLLEGDSNKIIELLTKGIIEIGVLRTPFDSDIFESIKLPAEPLAVAMSQNGCQYGERPDFVRLAELAEAPLILPYRWEPMFREHCKKAGFEPKVVCRSDGIMHDLLWANSGIAMALAPKSAAALIPGSTLIYKTIIDPVLLTQTAIIWMRNRTLSTAARHFLGLLTEMVPE